MKELKLLFGGESKNVRRTMHELYKHPKDRVVQNNMIQKPKYVKRNGVMVPYEGP